MPAKVGMLKEMLSLISLIIKVMQMEKHILAFETLLRFSCNHKIQEVRMALKCQKLDSILAQSQMWSILELLCISTGTWFYSQSSQSNWELAQVETWSCRDCLSVGAGSRFHCMLRAQEVLRQNVLTQQSAGTTGLYCTSQDVTVSTYWWFSLSCSTNIRCHESRVLQQCPRGLSLAKINQEVHLWRSCHSALSTHFKYAKNKLYK